MTKVEEVKLLAVREDTYTVYVFQKLDTKEYIMCTRLPDWKVPDIRVGDSGFLEYQNVKAGEPYFDSKQEVTAHYLYSNVYFMNFVQKSEILQHNEIIL